MVITRKMADQGMVTKHELFQFVAEASTLGLPPGKWPKVIETELGNKQPFVLQHLNENDAVYGQLLGCITLRILND